jgi:hydroxymethylbilane synthase
VARVRIGSRGSQLALWQANHVKRLLEAQGHPADIEIITTTGDKITGVALARVGTKGMFIKEIEEALKEGRIDVAVHSLKDLPTEIAPDFEIAAIPKRQDPRDAFCSLKYGSVDDLGRGARVGTSSLRRQAQLKSLRPDLQILALRGNVDSRLRKLETGEYDAVVLAAAGLKRLGRTELVRQVFAAEVMCPAAGQGALALEIRARDSVSREILGFLDDTSARRTTGCERALLRKLGGGCQVPIGAHAEIRDAGLRLQAMVGNPNGSKLLRESRDGSDPVELGEAVAALLLAGGGAAILHEIYREEAPTAQQP